MPAGTHVYTRSRDKSSNATHFSTTTRRFRKRRINNSRKDTAGTIVGPRNIVLAREKDDRRDRRGESRARDDKCDAFGHELT